MLIKAFQSLRPPGNLAPRVASPPYDVVDTEEAAALAAGNSLSFLHVTRAEIDLPPGTDPHADEVYARAGANLREFTNNGTLIRDDTPAIYLYRIAGGGAVQHGVVCCCHAAECGSGIIRRHERTRRDKEDDRARHIRAVGAHTGPVLLAYRDREAIDALTAREEKAPPLFDFTTAAGERHTVWRAAAGDPWVELFREVPRAYVADGHHRLAAAARVAAENGAAAAEREWILCALFPAGQLRILPYNRVVRDLNGHSPASLLAACRERVSVTDAAGPHPDAPGHVRMYIERRWYDLAWPASGPPADAVHVLDATVLQERLLAPALDIADPGTSGRIDFVGGRAAAETMVRMVDGGRAAVGFAMYPVGIGQLMAVADSGGIMPPKSTWFEPKLRSGLLVHPC